MKLMLFWVIHVPLIVFGLYVLRMDIEKHTRRCEQQRSTTTTNASDDNVCRLDRVACPIRLLWAEDEEAEATCFWSTTLVVGCMCSAIVYVTVSLMMALDSRKMHGIRMPVDWTPSDWVHRRTDHALRFRTARAA
jgi:hypothetical protein